VTEPAEPPAVRRPGSSTPSDDSEALPEDPEELKELADAVPSVGDMVGDARLPRWFWRAVVGIAFSVAAFLALRGVLEKLTGLLGLIGTSLFLAFAMEPGVNWLAKRGWKRGPATLFCFFLVFVVGGLFAWLMVDLVVGQVTDLVDQAPEYIADATGWINDTFGTEITSTELNQTIRDYQEDLAGIAADAGGRVLTLTGTAVGVIFQMFTVFLFSYYMIAEGPKLRRNACSLLPPQRQQVVLRLWELAVDKTGGWVYSRLLLAIIGALTSWIVFQILGLPSPVALALWFGLTSQFIPVLGTYLGGSLPVLIALMNSPIDAVWVLGWMVLYQQVENYLLAPRITAHTMDLHPAVAFGAALAGASLFGPLGAVLALPGAAVIQAFVSSYLSRHEVIESELTRVDEEPEASDEPPWRRAMQRFATGRNTREAPKE
jgi:predicted PurR-regulated permease PerM